MRVRVRVQAGCVGVVLAVRPLVAQHQVHQVLLLPAGVGGDVAQQQVLPQVLDAQAHQLRPLEGRALQQVAGSAPAQVLLQHRAQGAEVLLAVAADVLSERGRGERGKDSRGVSIPQTVENIWTNCLRHHPVTFNGLVKCVLTPAK